MNLRNMVVTIVLVKRHAIMTFSPEAEDWTIFIINSCNKVNKNES